MPTAPKRDTTNRNHLFHEASTFSPKPGVALPVMTQKGPLVLQYLQSLYRVFDQAMQDHKRVFVLRFDLHLPAWMCLTGDQEDNRDIVRRGNLVMTKLFHFLKLKIWKDLHDRQSPHRCQVRYAYAREISNPSGRIHYHVVLLLNLHAYRTIGTIDYEGPNLYWRIADAWKNALRLPDLKEASGYLHVDFGNESYRLEPTDGYVQLPKAFYRASYLCKAQTKYFGQRYRGFSTSQK